VPDDSDAESVPCAAGEDLALEADIMMHDDLAGTSERVLAEPGDEPNQERRILCATDLTERSRDAERRAALLAEQMGAQVLFVHAVPESRIQRVRRRMFARAHMQLLSHAERAMTHAPGNARVSVRQGSAMHAITDAAKNWEPDLIVMARPLQRTLDLVLGTTAERVIRATHRPVLVVNAAASHRYRNLVLATDMSDVCVCVARTLISMGMLKDTYAWIVHAFHKPYRAWLGGCRAEPTAHQQQWRRALSSELLRKMSAEGVDPSRVQVVVEHARPLDAIQKCLQQVRPELLVVGTSRWFMLKRILFGSVADQVLRQVDCDVLALSPHARAPLARELDGREAMPLPVPDQSLSV